MTVPAGTLITVRLDEALSSDRNQPRRPFRAVLDQPLIVDGLVLAEKGARALGKVTDADRAGRVRGLSRLVLELTQLNTSDGQKSQDCRQKRSTSREKPVRLVMQQRSVPPRPLERPLERLRAAVKERRSARAQAERPGPAV